MEDIRIIAEELPVIQINFEEVKKSLQDMLVTYSTIVVTSESLPDCKEAQRQLASLRVKLDKYRVEKKKEMLKPIEHFESQMKELVSLVEMVEKPIKEGVKTYDDKIRDANRIIAENIVKDMVVKYDLRDKYAKQFIITDKHCQLSAKKTEVMQDLNRQGMELKAKQDHEDELLGILTDAIIMENKTIQTQLSIDRFMTMVDKGMPFKDVLQEIRNLAEMTRTAEANVKTEVVLPKVDPKGIFNTEEEEPAVTRIFEVTATKKELDELEAFIRKQGYFCLIR